MKRIVICADGTWNQRDQIDKATKKRRPTDVTKTARAVRPRSSNGTDQVVCYHDGVGTAEGLDKFTGGAFGRGIENNIRELYRFLVYNYDEGDDIYFFGFSRGAFTVRTLVGFMYKVGLVQKDDDYYVPELYAYYESGKGADSDEYKLAYHNIKDPRACPPIKFIGVWDTVGALGAPGFLGQVFNKNKYLYHDLNLNANIQNAYQALAIDEQRKPFAPNIWTRPPGWTGTLEQVWFPGVHSNIGGGYAPDGLANEALHWLVEKAENLELEFDGKFLNYYKPCFNSTLRDSMTAMYKVMGRYIRPIGEYLADGEAIHQSALDRMNLPACHYAPENLLKFLKSAGAAPATDTSRVPRGTPC
jgi:uncharacterized protein (DUF2235 family)